MEQSPLSALLRKIPERRQGGCSSHSCSQLELQQLRFLPPMLLTQQLPRPIHVLQGLVQA